MLAGLRDPDRGPHPDRRAGHGGVPPDKRPTNMMFQSYALFPHMTVEKNVAYGLLREGKSKRDEPMRAWPRC
jgi:putrescine transport system ATP-binding protein